MKPSKRNPLPQHLVDEWHPTKNGDLKPEDVTAGSNKKRWWIGAVCAHEWEQVVSKRVSGTSKCPYCSNRRLLAGFNDLATTHPLIARQWAKENTVGATETTAGSPLKRGWICDLGHYYRAAVVSRTRIGSGCPYCANKKTLPGFNDIATTHPYLVDEWRDENRSPHQVTYGSEYAAEWECIRGHTYRMSVSAKASGARCPVCLNRKIVEGENSLVSKFPEIASEWDYSKNSVYPSEIGPGAAKSYWWLCPKKHSYKSKVEDRTKRGAGCVCQGERNRVIVKGYNDLPTLNPAVAKDWDYDKNKSLPFEIGPGSGKKIWWLCDKGHSWIAIVAERAMRGRGCPYCGNRLLATGFNDLTTVAPDVAEEWDYGKNTLLPSEVKVDSEKYYFICKENKHSYIASLYHRVSNKSGCPHCASSRQWSAGEKSLLGYIASIVGTENVVANSRKIISPYELDIYLPNLNLAIEYNGDYWHSDEVIRKRTGMSADEYHLNKVERCRELGITLVFVWDGQWTNHRSEIEGTIRSLVLGEIESPEVLSMFTLSSPSRPNDEDILAETERSEEK